MLTPQRTARAAAVLLAGLLLASAPTVTASAASTAAPTAVGRAAMATTCGHYEGTDSTQRHDDGERVREVQCLINRWHGKEPLAIDGHYGPRTESWVVLFQESKGLTVDGQVGPQTWGALRGA
ncbi:peptidoglycan-binding protein [Streptomyces piniterrae]|uniref:Peptidoglycan-binding protein n=1 Tax=Streptomyces piniterrae TaxID=2571125 RepID=A0A4U0MUZ7_9ACTN|nr:peptidoglycan-binding domain-containing protein [Streptomyces piniterrae]TJZ44546.1 peptidoglycan-binding protein [Streptomyces piniterrae]